MTTERSVGVLHRLRTLYGLGSVGALTDAQLLDRFCLGRDEERELVFEALVERHGPMVLRVCQDLLGNSHDTQDAFQATFLVLARRATSIRQPDQLRSWLYGVAMRVAMKARGNVSRRRHRETQDPAILACYPARDFDRERLFVLLHEEIGKLPLAYRELVFSCYLEGKTYQEAARRLEMSEGAVRCRLARAKNLLRDRLARRGLTFSATMMIEPLTRRTSLVPTRNSVLALARLAMGRGTAAPTVLELVGEVAPSWVLVYSKAVAVVLVILSLLGTGAGAVAQNRSAETTVELANEQEPARGVAERDGRDQEAKRVEPLTLGGAIDHVLRTDPVLVQIARELSEPRGEALAAFVCGAANRYEDTALVSFGYYGNPANKTQYNVNITWPTGIAQTRSIRRVVKCAAKTAREAQYQEAVRQIVGRLSETFFDVLVQAQFVDIARERVDDLDEIAAVVAQQFSLGRATQADVDALEKSRMEAMVRWNEAKLLKRQAKESLGTVLRFGPDRMAQLEPVGKLRTLDPLPSVETLRSMAVTTRPDLIAIRIELHRDEQDLETRNEQAPGSVPHLTEAKPQTDKTSSRVAVILPDSTSRTFPFVSYKEDPKTVLIKKQKVAQNQERLTQLEAQVAHDVVMGVKAWRAALASLQRQEAKQSPVPRQDHQERLRRYARGELPLAEVLSAYREREVQAREYVDASARHRKAGLALNALIGQRICR